MGYGLKKGKTPFFRVNKSLKALFVDFTEKTPMCKPCMVKCYILCWRDIFPKSAAAKRITRITPSEKTFQILETWKVCRTIDVSSLQTRFCRSQSMNLEQRLYFIKQNVRDRDAISV
jgi:hypothetical protein